jgi:hypothetical protein
MLLATKLRNWSATRESSRRPVGDRVFRLSAEEPVWWRLCWRQRQARDQRDQLAAFMQDQPVTAALIALIRVFLNKLPKGCNGGTVSLGPDLGIALRRWSSGEELIHCPKVALRFAPPICITIRSDTPAAATANIGR